MPDDTERKNGTPPCNFSWVVKGQLAAMGWPQSKANLVFLASHGIKHLITLSPEMMPPIDEFPVMNWTKIPVEEFEAPTLDQIKQFIQICEKCSLKNEAVGIHCRQGRGRTGVMAACFLVRFQGLTAERAIMNLRIQRPGIEEVFHPISILWDQTGFKISTHDDGKEKGRPSPELPESKCRIFQRMNSHHCRSGGRDCRKRNYQSLHENWIGITVLSLCSTLESTANFSKSYAAGVRFSKLTWGPPEPKCLCAGVSPRNGAQSEEKSCTCSCEGILEFPSNLSENLCVLSVSGGDMEILKANAFDRYRKTLQDLNLFNLRRLREIEPGAFHNLPRLRTIYISGAQSLISLKPSVFSEKLPQLKTLRIVHSGLKDIPYLNKLETRDILHTIDFESNHIEKIPSYKLQVRAQEVLLSFNSIREIEEDAFKGSQIAKLILKGNMKLTKLHANAFRNLQSLSLLDLSLTSITFLPTNGLSDLETLRLQDTHTLKVFPSVYNFDYIKEAELTYTYHCCAFQFPDTHSPEDYKRHQEFVKSVQKACSEQGQLLRRQRHVLAVNKTSMFFPGSWGQVSLENKSTYSFLRMVAEEEFHEEATVTPLYAMCGNLSKNYRNVTCIPAPDAFNPCEDIMGNWALRIQVWFVAIFALFGNFAVLLVLISSRFRMTVPKFLMCNLAVADLCMGLYLLLIAVMDVRSIGVYFNFAIDWQNGWGCQVAGFLTVLSSELSIFTLSVITSERWYTITYAIHLNRRLKLKTAVHIMACGWIYSIIMAFLPLTGVSSYSKTSICLPLENRETKDIAYLITLLVFNGLAFSLICVCYGRMYCSIKENQDVARTHSDMTVAKRMALLVFTDFACWAPITFFGLTAIAGCPLIDVSRTKILLVFFYPLNSCANPYLYALLTQQYQRDLFILLSRYGLCSRRAARFKGATGTAPRCNTDKDVCKTGTNCQNNTPNHRGSVLTTLTSLDNTNNSRPLVPVLEFQTTSADLPPSNNYRKYSYNEQSERLSNSSLL